MTLELSLHLLLWHLASLSDHCSKPDLSFFPEPYLGSCQGGCVALHTASLGAFGHSSLSL